MNKRRTFTQLTQKKRDRIESLLDEGVTQTEVARILKVDKSTISREVARRRKEDGRYDAEVAEHKAKVKRSGSKHQGMKVEKYPELKKRIISELKQKRSPDEIAGRMWKERLKPRIGTSAIYKWLYSAFGQRYCKYLCTKRYRKRKQKKKTKREMIPNRVSLSKRPRTKGLVHAEGDTLVSGRKTGSRGAASLVVLKKTKLLFGNRLPNLKPSSMVASVRKIEAKVSIDTLTLDNGIENKYHEMFEVPAYFCDPHAPWQKPLVEQNIGLMRRWGIKKGSDLSKLSEKEYQKMLHYLNSKYRKSLGYQNAYEAAYRDGIIERLPEGGCI